MTDATPDKEKGTHGALWYVTLGLLVYVANYPIVLAYAVRVEDVDSVNWRLLKVIYSPLDWLIEAVGMGERFNDFVY